MEDHIGVFSLFFFKNVLVHVFAICLHTMSMLFATHQLPTTSQSKVFERVSLPSSHWLPVFFCMSWKSACKDMRFAQNVCLQGLRRYNCMRDKCPQVMSLQVGLKKKTRMWSSPRLPEANGSRLQQLLLTQHTWISHLTVGSQLALWVMETAGFNRGMHGEKNLGRDLLSVLYFSPKGQYE